MDDVNTPEFWNAAYREGRDAWTLGAPTPVFEAMARDGVTSNDGTVLQLPKGRLLIPCSGHGHDALLFAEQGHHVTAVDMASESNAILRARAEQAGLEVEVLEEDMFTLAPSHNARYSVLVEYTCLCAIDPSRRDEFVQLAARVLAAGGWYVTLLFPIDGRPGGPPYAIDSDQWQAMMEKDFRLLYRAFPDNSIRPRAGKERLEIWERRG